MKLKHVIVTCALTIVALVALMTLVPLQTAQAAPSYDWNFSLSDSVNGNVTAEVLTGLTRKEAMWWCETYQGFGEVSVTKLGSTHNICH